MRGCGRVGCADRIEGGRVRECCGVARWVGISGLWAKELGDDVLSAFMIKFVVVFTRGRSTSDCGRGRGR